MNANEDYNAVMCDKKLFGEMVYTPLSEALELLKKRRNNKVIANRIAELLKNDVPEDLKNSTCAVLARNIATPNFESRRFVSLALENSLQPLFFEYLEDKFIPQNDFKRSLGVISIHHGVGKKGGDKTKKKNIVDFNTQSGKKFNDVVTRTSESLVGFHRKLYKDSKSDNQVIFFDASKWYHDHGGHAIDYYTNFLLLFVRNGILFENFLASSDTEGDFTKKIVLPALKNVLDLTGVKPLIVPLSPLDIESDNYWYYHLPCVEDHVKEYE